MASLAYEILLLAALCIAGAFASLAWSEHLDPVLARPALQVLLLSLVGGYFVWQWRRGGQTLPMKAWRLRVVSTSGAPLTLLQAARRFVVAAAGTLCFGVGVLWAFHDRDRQFLHDRLAGTRIIAIGS